MFSLLFMRIFRFFKIRKMLKDLRMLCSYQDLLEKLRREYEPFIDLARREIDG